MANADGTMGQGHEEGGGTQPPSREPSDVVEPTVLEKDVPWPAQWHRVLGPGGEDLGDGLVPVEPHGPEESHARSVALPRPGGRVAAGVAAGIVGLAALLVAVLFSFDGAPPGARDDVRVATLSVPAQSGSSVADWVAASGRLQARLDRSAKRQRAIALERRERAIAREKRERARRRERERRPPPARTSGSGTTQVAATPPPAAPAPEPALDPWANVSPAEREFTPGPWNLS